MKKVKTRVNKPSIVPPPEIQKSNFELELLWCIQSLENSLALGKMNQRETERVSKAIKTLKSPKEVFIKKRQLMSQMFGNYREKMDQEKKQFSLDRNKMKIAAVEANKKSIFLKKASKSDANIRLDSYFEEVKNDQPEELNEKTSLQLSSKSNFNSSPSDNTLSQGSSSSCSQTTSSEDKKLEKPENVRYVSAGNTFRFNFNIENILDDGS